MGGPALIAVVVDALDAAAALRAEELAWRTGLPLASRDPAAVGAELCLAVTDARLELREAGNSQARPLFVDFVSGPTGYRRRSGGGRGQPIGRAVGLRTGCRTIFDATAGLGRDAFLLACLGCEVVACERSPVIAAMLYDALERARRVGDDQLAAICDRLVFREGDAIQALASLSPECTPEVVYVDPMYAPLQRSALSKKELRILRRIVGDDVDAGELLCVARAKARRRTVVKRHHSAPPLAPDVSHSVEGQRVRYDVYLS
ncbi:MAG: class I SAM-dependent methyltransferase [Planctomycetota bacterium]